MRNPKFQHPATAVEVKRHGVWFFPIRVNDFENCPHNVTTFKREQDKGGYIGGRGTAKCYMVFEGAVAGQNKIIGRRPHRVSRDFGSLTEI